MGAAKIIDMLSLERDFRMTALSYKQLGEKYNISPGRISQLKKERNWSRDLQEAVKSAAHAKLVNGPKQRLAGEAPLDDLIEAEGDRLAKIVESHRDNVAQLKRIATRLAASVERHLDKVDEMLLGGVTKRDLLPSETDALIAARSAATRDLAALAQIHAKIVPLERQAWYISDDKPDDDDASEIVINMVSYADLPKTV